MSPRFRPTAAGAVTLAVLVLTGGAAGSAPAVAPVPAPGWGGFAADAQHTGQAKASPQPLTRVHWHAPVDRRPVTFPPDGTFAHYASPLITSRNTVIVPTRIGANRGFELVGYDGSDGTRKWRMPTDYDVPTGSSLEFPPPMPATLVDDHHVAVAGAGGTVLIRSRVDGAKGFVRRVAFYGLDHYRAHQAAYDKAVQITTPLTTGPDGSLYFGFRAAADAPGHLRNGVARVSPSGQGAWIAARALGRRSLPSRVTIGCAPALSPDGSTGYIAVVSGERAWLTGFDTATMQPKFRHFLRDPQTHKPAFVIDQSSATPTVGPDGDVFYGVLGNPFRRHDDRGWLLHFDSQLTKARTPGSFGWDQTVAVVPSASVPSYTGSSSYLLVSKYNNYLLGPHGDGRMEIALLDPHAAQLDRFSPVQVMKEVRTALSPLHIPHTPQGTRYEWCINAVAVDPATGTVIANNEDGHLYRWDLDTGQLPDDLRLNGPRGQAYTSTVIGPDGTAYAIQNAVLYAVGR
jgi:outer membrane protein assembly factor BamB